jgi:3-deoxy-D-manno-octulosonic-acid transferase
VFWYPLDFAWAVRAYLNVLQPKLLVLMESELWPRMLVECRRRGVPVAVVNARVSDRSYRRGLRVKAVWGRVLRWVNMFLAQSEEDGRRLVAMGARAEAVRVVGNLKYDVRAVRESALARQFLAVLDGYSLVVAGSTLPGEEEAILDIWRRVQEATSGATRTKEGSVLPMLVIAPRHPDRFEQVRRLIFKRGYSPLLCSQLLRTPAEAWFITGEVILLLDTIGDLAAAYGVARVAFVGGSLVKRGGHNPLEPAQFGVPVAMGPSFENFRDVVGKMQAADGIRIVQDEDELEAALVDLLTDREKARAMGERGRRVFEEQQGATGRTVEALVGLVRR